MLGMKLGLYWLSTWETIKDNVTAYNSLISSLLITWCLRIMTGPVRHFMELVVTGLSKNPNYSAQEKREYVEWYKEYFNQFTPEELQAIMTTKQESQ